MPTGKNPVSLGLLLSLFFAALLAAFALAFFFIFHMTMPRMLLDAEDKYLTQQLNLVEGLLGSARENITLLAEDTATWEEAALFAEGKNPGFIANNWPEKSLLESFRLNFVIIKDRDGNNLYTDFLDLRTKEQLSEPPRLSETLAPYAREVMAAYAAGKGSGNAIGKEGILFFGNAAYNVALMPIIPSREAKEASGTLILGNILDDAYFKQLTHYTEGTFSIVEEQENPAMTAGQEASGAGAPGEILHLDEDTVATRTFLPAIDGRPLLLFMTEKRQIYAEGKQRLNEANILMLAAMVLFGLALYQAIARLVIRPIGKLSKDIQAITATEDLGSAVTMAERNASSREFLVLCDSITRMLEKLGESRISLDMLQRLLDGLDAYIFVADPDDGTLLFMNGRARDHYGIQGPLAGRSYRDIMRQGDDASLVPPVPALLSGQRDIVVWEDQNPRTGRQYRNTNCLIEWGSGKMVVLQHTVDITNIKEAESSLKKRLKQQELMSAMTRSFIATASMEDLINNALRMAGEFMGLSKVLLARHYPEEAALNADYEWYSDDSACIRPETARIPFDKNVAEYQGFIVEKRPYMAMDDISILPEHAYALGQGIRSLAGAPIFVFGSFWGILSFAECGRVRPWSESDIQLITLIGSIISGVIERDTRDRELVLMSSIVESAPQFISYSDQAGNLRYVSKGSQKALGYTPEELVSGGMSLILDETVRRNVLQNLLPKVQAEGSLSFELPLRIKGGEERIFSFSCFAVHEEQGTGAITQDVTDQRRLEHELVQAKELAEQSNMAKSDFLSRMSHEMRTPLNAIIGMTSIGTAAADLEKKQYCLDKIGDASNHLLGVINDILDMSKIEANKFELSYTEFAFEKMLMRVLNVVNFRIEEKGQTIAVTVSPDLPYAIVSDDQRLAQVIANLLSNAVKFTPEKGSITLSASLVEEIGDECVLRIDVSDTGIGISPENQARLFQSFEQADGGIARKFGGTGLGLAISKRIVEMMGGSIWVESKAGEGSRFSFTIKARRGEATCESALGADIDWPGLRILTVDDAPEVREYFRNLANTLGFACETAKDGFQAWEILERTGINGFDIIFIDWKMPGMDGIELAAKIMETGERQPVIIMISAFEWDVIEKDAKAAGVENFIPKPLFAASIIDAITNILGGRPAADHAVAPSACSFEGMSILLAEDIEINREIVLTMLENTGIQIDCAENGQQACDLFQANPDKYAMIFMDIHMPEVDGYEATRRIRAMKDIPRAREIPIIAMTANVFREDIERCLAAGMNGHIGKPVNFDEMFEKLRGVCLHASGGQGSALDPAGG